MCNGSTILVVFPRFFPHLSLRSALELGLLPDTYTNMHSVFPRIIRSGHIGRLFNSTTAGLHCKSLTNPEFVQSSRLSDQFDGTSVFTDNFSRHSHTTVCGYRIISLTGVTKNLFTAHGYNGFIHGTSVETEIFSQSSHTTVYGYRIISLTGTCIKSQSLRSENFSRR